MKRNVRVLSQRQEFRSPKNKSDEMTTRMHKRVWVYAKGVNGLAITCRAWKKNQKHMPESWKPQRE